LHVSTSLISGHLTGEGVESSAVLVLCLNLGRTYTFHCRRKSKRASKWLGPAEVASPARLTVLS